MTHRIIPDPISDLLNAAKTLYALNQHYHAVATLHEEAHRRCEHLDLQLREAQQACQEAQNRLLQAATQLGATPDFSEENAAVALHVPVDAETVDPRMVSFPRGREQ